MSINLISYTAVYVIFINYEDLIRYYEQNLVLIIKKTLSKK